MRYYIRKRLLPSNQSISFQAKINYHNRKRYDIIPAMKKNAPKKIAVILTASGMAGRDYLQGTFRYVNTRTGWMLDLLNSNEDFEHRIRDYGLPDGVLSIIPHEKQMLAALLKLDIPSVIVDIPPETFSFSGKRISFVRLNDEMIGCTAAEHLLSRGRFNSFACMIDEPQFGYPAARERGFRQRLEHEGRFVKTLVIPETTARERERKMLELTLTRLPRPLAVFAVRDRAALKIFDACRRLKLSIPTEVAVLGVDNDELFCESLPIPLSSILPDHEQVGFLAARELNQLFKGRNGGDKVLDKSVKDIVLRASTRIVPPAARIVSNALTFIEKNVSGSLRVSDVAAHLGVSRRLLDLRFRQIQNESVLDAIVRTRIGKIKKRLFSTSDSITRIAKDCGFSSSAALVRFFKARTGQSPNRWRQKPENIQPRHSGRSALRGED